MGDDTSPDTVSNGSAVHAYLYDKAISVGGLGKTFDIIQGKGGGRIWVRAVQGISDIANIPLQLSGYDNVLEGYWNESTVDSTTNTNVDIAAQNHENPNPPRFISLHSSELHLTDGTSKWLTRVLLNGQVVQPSGKTQTEQGGVNPNPLDYEIVAKRSTRLPWGQLFSANSNISTYDNADYEIFLEADYPYAITTYIDDGTATADAFTLGYAPAVTTVANSFVYNEGVDDSSNVSIAANGNVSLTAANDAGDIMVVVYPTLFAAAG